MSISNEDRRDAIVKVAIAMQGVAYGPVTLRKAERVVDMLLSDGWGPPPGYVVQVEKSFGHQTFSAGQPHLPFSSTIPETCRGQNED